LTTLEALSRAPEQNEQASIAEAPALVGEVAQTAQFLLGRSRDW
jgi:hypothetical protein